MPQQQQPLPPVYNQPPQGPGTFNPGGWAPQPWAPPGQQPPGGGGSGGGMPINVFANANQPPDRMAGPGVSTGAAAEGGPGGANVGRQGNPGYGLPGLGATNMTGPIIPASQFGAGASWPGWATPSAGTVGGLAGSAVAGPVGGILGNYFASRITGNPSWTTRAADTLTGSSGGVGGGESWWARLMAAFNREQQEH